MSVDRPVPSADFEITPEDWEAVNAAHLFDSPLYVDLTSKSRVIGGLLFVTLALFSLVLGSASAALLFAIAGPPFVYAMGPLQRKAQLNSLKRMSEEGISNGLFGHHRVEIRDEGLFHGTHAFESLIRWHAIEEVKDKAGHFFVYTGPNAFIPIPVTAFPDSDSLRAFADGFHERMVRVGTGGESIPPMLTERIEPTDRGDPADTDVATGGDAAR